MINASTARTTASCRTAGSGPAARAASRPRLPAPWPKSRPMHHHHPLPFILFLIHFFFFKQNLYKFFFLKFNVFLQLLSKYVFHISVFQVCSFFFSNRKQSFLQSKTTNITTRITATATDSSFNPTWGVLRQRNVAVAYCWRRVLFFLVTIHGRLHVRTTRPSLAQTPRPRHIRRSATPPSRRGRSHQDGQTCIMSAQLLHHHEIGSPIKFGDLIVSRRSLLLITKRLTYSAWPPALPWWHHLAPHQLDGLGELRVRHGLEGRYSLGKDLFQVPNRRVFHERGASRELDPPEP